MIPVLSQVVPNKFQVAILIATLASLSACQSIPKKQTEPLVAQPNLPIESPYQVHDDGVVSNPNLPSIASQRWQDFYSDHRLKELIRLALENNKGVEATVLAIRQAQAQYQITEITDIPKINASTSASRSGDFQGNSGAKYSVGLALASYEFDFWGKIASQKEAALQDFLATTTTKDSAEISLISNIAQSYVAYSYNLAQLHLAQQTLKSREASLELNRKRFLAGLDSELTSVQAQSAVESAKIAIATAETELLKNQNALRYLVGVPVDKHLLPPAGIASITSNKIFNAGLPSELLRYRPDIRQAEYNIKSAGANIEAVRATFYPNISLSTKVGASSTSLSNLFKTGAFSWEISPLVSLPIFDGGTRKMNYEVATIAQKQALNSYEQVIQTAFKEVADVLASRARLKEQQTAYSKMLVANQKNLNIAETRFNAGLDNYLGVLDAQRSIFNNEQSILSIRQQELITQIELYKVLGGGVNNKIPLEPASPSTN